MFLTAYLSCHHVLSEAAVVRIFSCRATMQPAKHTLSAVYVKVLAYRVNFCQTIRTYVRMFVYVRMECCEHEKTRKLFQTLPSIPTINGQKNVILDSYT